MVRWQEGPIRGEGVPKGSTRWRRLEQAREKTGTAFVCCLGFSITLFFLYHFLVLLYGWTLGIAPYAGALCGVYLVGCFMAASCPSDQELMRRPMIARAMLITNTASMWHVCVSCP